MISPITPPFELMNQWYKKACKDPYNGGKFIMSQVLKDICNSAAQWGADQELEACCEWLGMCKPHQVLASVPADLRATRRPKPQSETDQALEALNQMDKPLGVVTASRASIIRRALERLKELEAVND